MSAEFALWGGVECTINRVRDRYFSQLERSGHAHRSDDLDRFASLGVTMLRYPVLWESVAPHEHGDSDWRWPDERLLHLHQLGIAPVIGLVHHGSGPAHTSLLDEAFPDKLARYAGAVARRYPWVQYYTPVNEPLTTARFSALYGVWYPHAADDRSFVKAVVLQCRATVLAMRAIREINPQAVLVQTDDLGKTYSTRALRSLADFYNERRWLAWDLLCGRVGPGHALWDYLTRTDTGAGMAPAELLWFRDHPCPPDIIGVNYYITSERWLDHRRGRYPEAYAGSYRGVHCVDIETPRALATPTPGIAPLLAEAWQRYQIPLAVTEAHIDAHREDQLRWFTEIWDGARQAREQGVKIEAVTCWALLGSFDWNTLVTRDLGYYEPGPFDIRSPAPRPTALAHLLRELSVGQHPSHPVLSGEGWWRRAGRFLCPPVPLSEIAEPYAVVSSSVPAHAVNKVPVPAVVHQQSARPLLIVGASGTLGRAFARICSVRQLAFRAFGRAQLDIANAAAVDAAIREHQPWAIVNAGGYVRVDEAQTERERCHRENVLGAVVLAVAGARHGVPLLSFSTDLVFNGDTERAYVERDEVAPLNVYGQSKAEAERRMLAICPGALVIRTSAFFGPWDRVNFLTLALDALAAGQPFAAAADIVITPTYVPDLAHTALNLLIDGECGLWHLSNHEPLSWSAFGRKAAQMAGISDRTLEARPAADFRYAAQRPLFSALASERAQLMPSLDDALQRYLRLRAEAREQDETGLLPLQGRS